MIDEPTAHRWSSCASHCGLRTDTLLTPHTAYAALASTPEARVAAYRHQLREARSEDDLASICTYLQQQHALGRDDFRAMFAAKTIASPMYAPLIARRA
ncbi:MAG: hypothetical protein WBV61_04540 [Rhodanobacteraceae bacterium]